MELRMGSRIQPACVQIQPCDFGQGIFLVSVSSSVKWGYYNPLQRMAVMSGYVCKELSSLLEHKQGHSQCCFDCITEGAVY